MNTKTRGTSVGKSWCDLRMQKLKPRSSALRLRRYSAPGNCYLLSTSTHKREPLFVDKTSANLVLSAARWLDVIQQIRLDAVVVMPNHVHMACALTKCSSLSRLMQSYKSFTAHRLVDLGAEAPVWQTGYHDHAARSEQEYVDCIRYLLDNPVRAELVDRAQDYPFLYAHEDWFNG
ncbi:MAG: transposase [Pseudomonadota bacterium]